MDLDDLQLAPLGIGGVLQDLQVACTDLVLQAGAEIQAWKRS